jgi:hypothetical protein
MTRQTVRTLKRALRDGLRGTASETERVQTRESALALLTRSVDMGHKRLAVIRLEMAVGTGASIPQELWVYCARMADASSDPKLQTIYKSAAISVAQESRHV